MLCIRQYPIDGVIWAYSFRAPVIRKVIHDLKYRKRQGDIAKLTPRLEKAIAREKLPADMVLVAIPLHPKREQERGFNQAELIASSLGYPTRENILSRIKETPPQARTISRKDRFLHIQGAFAIVERAECIGKDFLLIDDVATTGATITEAARTLKENGARHVYAAVLAHG